MDGIRHVRETSPAKARLLELLVPLCLIVWRLASQPLVHVWRDWVVILSCYWLFVVLKPQEKDPSQALVATMAFLLGIYVLGQLPLTLRLLGIVS